MRSILLSTAIILSPMVSISVGEDAPRIAIEDIDGRAFHLNLQQIFQKEYPIILKAAKRNGIEYDDYENLAILFAIRKAENGRKGIEFGVISNPRAIGKDWETWEVTLDRQAGWAAATIMKNRERWAKDPKEQMFIVFLAKRYAPVGVENDPDNLNRHWLGNVMRISNKYMKFLPKTREAKA